MDKGDLMQVVLILWNFILLKVVRSRHCPAFLRVSFHLYMKMFFAYNMRQ